MYRLEVSLLALVLTVAEIVFITDKHAKVAAFRCESKIATQNQQLQRERRNVCCSLLPSSVLFPNVSTGAFRQSSMFARIYGADGTVVNDDEFENTDYGSDNKNDTEILESLTNAVDDQAVWTRIACAFAPPPHDRLNPELVRRAELVRVGGKSIDVAVAVPASVGPTASPSADQLAQVLVTVGYPQSWVDSKDLNMLTQQIRVLDGHAKDRLSERDVGEVGVGDDSQYYERIVIEKRWMERLQDEPDKNESLPQWWTTIAPQSSPLELVDECKLLKKLLNEDEFEDELRALFMTHYEDIGASIDFSAGAVALRVAVASIGSSGLYLKARIIDTAHDVGSEKLSAVSIPYEEDNSDKTRVEVKTAGELREAVLLLVESVVPIPVPKTETVKSVGAIPTTNDDKGKFTPFNEQVVQVVTNLEENAKPKATTTDNDSPAEIANKVEEDDVLPKAQSSSRNSSLADRRTYYQRKSPEDEAKLSAKYAAIEDLGERAYTILCDLEMI